MKKIIALMLTLALCASCVIVLASCGEAGESAYDIAVRLGKFEGTEEEFIDVYLKGEKGDKGEDGKDGKAGEEGAPGTAGANGLSAYELAKEKGLVPEGMTEDQWLASLPAEPGKPGEINFENLTFGVDADGYLTINGHSTGKKYAEIGQ